MLDKFLKSIFGSKNDRVLKDLEPLVNEINTAYETIRELSDNNLRGKTAEFKAQIAEAIKEEADGIADIKAQLDTVENVEEKALSHYGGRLIFGTSELPISSRNILKGELASSNYKMAAIPPSYIKQHDITPQMLKKIIDEFNSLKVIVLGDLIVDEYISCDGLGMSQADFFELQRILSTTAGMAAARSSRL